MLYDFNICHAGLCFFDSVLLKDALNSEMRVEEVLRKDVPQRGQDPET